MAESNWKEQTDPGAPVDSDTSDDDWFNKSLEDFELPAQNEIEEALFDLQKPRTPDNASCSRGPSASPVMTTAEQTTPPPKKSVKQKGRKKQTQDNKASASRTKVHTRTQVPSKECKTEEPEGERSQPCGVEGTATEWTDVGVTLKWNSDTQRQQLLVETTVTGADQTRALGNDDQEDTVGNGTGNPATGDESGDTDEGLNEDWFQDQLAGLPTVLKLRRVYTKKSMAQLQATLDSVTDPLYKLVDDIDDVEKDEDNSRQTFVKLQRNQMGDFTCVKTTNDRMTEWHTSRRSNFPANLKIVLKWLLKCKEEAEEEALRVYRKYPFSLVAVSNLFFILWRQGKRIQAAEVLKPFQQLRNDHPELHQDILCEDQGEYGRCCTELGGFLDTEAIASLEVARKKPHWLHYRFLLALNLRRSSRVCYQWTSPPIDVTSAFLQAIRLLIPVVETEDTTFTGKEELLVLKAAAASELGDMLHGDERIEDLRRNLEESDVLLESSHYFDIVSQIQDNGGPDLWRVAKYLRYDKNLNKSQELLKKACSESWQRSGNNKSSEQKIFRVAHLHDRSKAHHHMGLTLSKMTESSIRTTVQNSKHRADKPKLQRLGPKKGENKQELGVISYQRIHSFEHDPAMLIFQIHMKVPIYQFALRRKDKHVEEILFHWDKALRICGGENSEVSYDLGLIYKRLREYDLSLDHLLKIVQLDAEPVMVIKALEESALTYLEECSLGDKSPAAFRLQEYGKALLNITVLAQSRIVRQFRLVEVDGQHLLWRSFHILRHFMSLKQDSVLVSDRESSAEMWLLRLMRVYADNIPVLLFIQQCYERDIADPAITRNKFYKYLQDQRYEDALTLESLLCLTHTHKNDLDSCSTDLLKAYVQAARQRLMKDVQERRTGDTLNTELAKRFFRWAFEDAFQTVEHARLDVKDAHSAVSTSQTTGDTGPAVEATRPADEDTHPADEDTHPTDGNTHPTDGNTNPSGEHTHPTDEDTHPTDESTQPTDESTHPTDEASPPTDEASHPTDEDAHPTDEDAHPTDEASYPTDEDAHTLQSNTLHPAEVMTEDYHVALIHDPEVISTARDVQKLLHSVFGLRTQLTEPGPVDSMRRETLQAISNTPLSLFLISQRDLSPEMESYVRAAIRRSTSAPVVRTSMARPTPHLLTLTLNRAVTLPVLLQDHRSFHWDSDGMMTSNETRSDNWVNTVCSFFWFLIDIDLKL